MIRTEEAPGAIGAYSQGIMFKNLVITSGQLPIDPISGEMPVKAGEQATQSLNNIKAIVEASGLKIENIIKTTIFIKDMNQFSEINDAYAEFFGENKPARSTVEVARLPKDSLVEIEAIAIQEEK